MGGKHQEDILFVVVDILTLGVPGFFAYLGRL